MECAPHRMWKKLMALVLSLVMMAVMLPGALAVDLNVDAGFYFKQSRGGTCTLASAAMMLRRRAFLDGLTDLSLIHIWPTSSRSAPSRACPAS